MEDDQIKKMCEACGEREVFASCAGCDAGMCAVCTQFELIGSGCGCVWPAYFCSRCADDPHVNPNAPFRSPGSDA